MSNQNSHSVHLYMHTNILFLTLLNIPPQWYSDATKGSFYRQFLSCSSAKLQSSFSCCVPTLQLFFNFCMVMFFKPFFLQLRMRSEPPLVPPHTDSGCGCAAGTGGESGTERVQWCRMVRKLSNVPWVIETNVYDDEENHESWGWDSACFSATGYESSLSDVLQNLHVHRMLPKPNYNRHIPRSLIGKCWIWKLPTCPGFAPPSL